MTGLIDEMVEKGIITREEVVALGDAVFGPIDPDVADELYEKYLAKKEGE